MVAGGQICIVHAMPGLTQTPQEGLQQVVPASHTVFPHWMPLIGTHWALPSITLQVVLMAHLTVAQGVIESPDLVSIGLPLTPTVTKMARSRARGEMEKMVMVADIN
jgi:hypothetical protein